MKKILSLAIFTFILSHSPQQATAAQPIASSDSMGFDDAAVCEVAKIYQAVAPGSAEVVIDHIALDATTSLSLGQHYVPQGFSVFGGIPFGSTSASYQATYYVEIDDHRLLDLCKAAVKKTCNELNSKIAPYFHIDRTEAEIRILNISPYSAWFSLETTVDVSCK